MQLTNLSIILAINYPYVYIGLAAASIVAIAALLFYNWEKNIKAAEVVPHHLQLLNTLEQSQQNLKLAIDQSQYLGTVYSGAIRIDLNQKISDLNDLQITISRFQRLYDEGDLTGEHFQTETINYAIPPKEAEDKVSKWAEEMQAKRQQTRDNQ